MAQDRTELRRKYLSWCSAQISRSIVGLEAEQVFRLAQEIRDRERAGAGPPDHEHERLSYREAVRLLTDHFKRNLPDFESWVELYRADPDRYDSEIRDW